MKETTTVIDHIIALGGLKQSGKNTAADGLFAAGYKQIAFADKLREMVLVLDPQIWDQDRQEVWRLSEIVEDIGWDEAKERFQEVRRLLQVFGTEVIREHVHPDFWVNTVLNEINDGKWVVTDARFRNELDALEALGATTIWVKRPGIENNSSHASENSVSEKDFGCTVVNDATVSDLHKKLRLLAK